MLQRIPVLQVSVCTYSICRKKWLQTSSFGFVRVNSMKFSAELVEYMHYIQTQYFIDIDWRSTNCNNV